MALFRTKKQQWLTLIIIDPVIGGLISPLLWKVYPILGLGTLVLTFVIGWFLMLKLEEQELKDLR